MRLYSGTSTQFVEDTKLNQISGKLENTFYEQFRYTPSDSEVRSWQNSLRAMADVLEHAGLDDHGILLEYKLPTTSKRLDCLVTGHDQNQRESALIVELKQWSETGEAPGQHEVQTVLGGGVREVLHPSAQVGQYRRYLQDTHTAFYGSHSSIQLDACSYLHNYKFHPEDPLYAPKFEEMLEENPVFTMDQVPNLSDLLQSRVGEGDGLEVLREIEDGEYRPSKKLMQHVGEVIKGKEEYVLIDEQLVAYDKIFSTAQSGYHESDTKVLIIKGGPGTGKSVIALNVMADLLLDGYNTHYVTGSKSFTKTLRKVIGKRGKVQFKYFNNYRDADPNSIDVMICDEAHRIREDSNTRFMSPEERSDELQIEELLSAAKVAVFFIDDDQVVRPKEVGSVDFIKHHAERLDCSVTEMELEAQFRCGGAKGFLNWVNNTLNIKDTANVLWSDEEEFDFKIFDSPEALDEAIREKDREGHSARMTAGYCWDWTKETKEDGTLHNDVVIGDYERPWNAHYNATGLADDIPKAHYWAHDPNGINQVGCIYTAQGFEFDYVGVIIGKDLVYDLDEQRWIGNRDESEDYMVSHFGKDNFTQLVKNTYRVLLTRGLKGCYVHFLDKDTERFFRTRMERT
ncbi:DUF2075 domain-containing protein [Salinibacter ruber]|jgi:DUF2075 family protein|uniref:DUF2075 domain-containing protein n=1 Tax=Salinibacter ruber TaxID=146919 RepID=UPI001608A85D|nr:DUF2075 domain-containing protein [Salinibacter ruber]MBB4089596.1 hypothetical protein [Salinibacter ruber]